MGPSLVGAEIWFGECEITHINRFRRGKYQWAFDFTTGVMSSVGAKELLNLDLCWQLDAVEMNRFNINSLSQRIRLAECQTDNYHQQFRVIDGRLHSVWLEICLGHKNVNTPFSSKGRPTDVALSFQKCYPSTFGDEECRVDLVEPQDKSIRLFAERSHCLHKTVRFNSHRSGHVRGDKVWVKSCNASNTDFEIATEYWWSYDASTGLITSEVQTKFMPDLIPNKVFCLRLRKQADMEKIFYREQAILVPCDANDELQIFDFIEGRIYSRTYNKLCAGYDYQGYDSLENDGAAFMFSTCYANNWGAR